MFLASLCKVMSYFGQVICLFAPHWLWSPIFSCCVLLHWPPCWYRMTWKSRPFLTFDRVQGMWYQLLPSLHLSDGLISVRVLRGTRGFCGSVYGQWVTENNCRLPKLFNSFFKLIAYQKKSSLFLKNWSGKITSPLQVCLLHPVLCSVRDFMRTLPNL